MSDKPTVGRITQLGDKSYSVTSQGRTVVDPKKLLGKPHVKEMMRAGTSDQAAELSALRRRVLDMLIGITGGDPWPDAINVSLSEEKMVRTAIDVMFNFEYDEPISTLDAIVAALYAAGKRA